MRGSVAGKGKGKGACVWVLVDGMGCDVVVMGTA